AASVGTVAPLRDDAFSAERTRMSEDGFAFAVEVLGKTDAGGRLAQQPRERRTSDFPGVLPQVLTVERKQVEAVKEHIARAATPGQCRAQSLEVRHAAVVTHDAFAVERGGFHRRREQRLDYRRHLVGPVLRVAAEHALAVAVTASDKAIPVVLYLVGPALAL